MKRLREFRADPVYAGLATILAANVLHPFCLRRLNKPL